VEVVEVVEVVEEAVHLQAVNLKNNRCGVVERVGMGEDISHRNEPHTSDRPSRKIGSIYKSPSSHPVPTVSPLHTSSWRRA